MGQREHVVQFYEDESFLASTAARFIGGGIRAGDNALVIARQSTITSFRDLLTAGAIDLDRVIHSRQLVVLDAEETLARFMDGDMPDVGRFLDVVGGALGASMRERPRRFLRAYGEMVDVLWRQGNRRAAVALEGLWNELAHQHSFSLLCAHAMSDFATAADSLDFDAVCWAHTETLTQRACTSA